MKRFESASLSRANPFGVIPFGLCLLAFAACSGSGSGSGGGSNANNGGDFVVLKTDPVNGATIFLNDAVNIDFTSAIDLNSATLSTMTFQALNSQGIPVSELVVGNFTVGTTPGDTEPGRRAPAATRTVGRHGPQGPGEHATGAPRPPA